jgi:hypothetical protein
VYLAALRELKARVLKLLKEDEEFRYAVAGLIGLEEVLKRLDRHEAELVKLREDMNMLREDMVEGFKRHDEEIAKLREDMIAGFKRHDEEIAKLRKDMVEGFKRHDEEIAKLREDMIMGFKRHDEELIKLREDMNRGFELVERHISALGARWGVMAESAFREGLKGLLEKEFGFKVEKWRAYDEAGLVFGYQSEVDLDVAVSDGRLILVEFSSHVRASDVFQFKRKAELYKAKTGRKPDRLIMVAPYVDDKALEASKQLGVEVYTKV